MNGLLFYAIAWFIWLYFFFFTNQNTEYRRMILFVVLLLISASTIDIKWGEFFISGILALCIGLFLFLLMKSSTMEMIAIAAAILVVCSAQVSFFLFTTVNPVWMLLNDRVVQSILLFVLLSLFVKNTLFKLCILMISGSLANFVISFLTFSLEQYQIQLHYAMLDTFAVIGFIIFIQYRMYGYNKMGLT